MFNIDELNLNVDESVEYKWGKPKFFIENCENRKIKLAPPQLILLHSLKDVHSIN